MAARDEYKRKQKGYVLLCCHGEINAAEDGYSRTLRHKKKWPGPVIFVHDDPEDLEGPLPTRSRGAALGCTLDMAPGPVAAGVAAVPKATARV